MRGGRGHGGLMGAHGGSWGLWGLRGAHGGSWGLMGWGPRVGPTHDHHVILQRDLPKKPYKWKFTSI